MVSFEERMENFAKWDTLDNSNYRTGDIFGFEIVKLFRDGCAEVQYSTVNVNTRYEVCYHDNFADARDALIERLKEIKEMGLI